MPGQQPQRGQVGLELEVAEAPIPTGQAVALLGRHVDVGRQEVLAGFGAVRNGRFEEVPRGEPLADQAAFHVDQGKHDRVDVVAAHGALERVEAQRRRQGAVRSDR